MPVVFTFDVEAADTAERNRVQSLFERLGWENIGGSAYRYPRLGTDDQPVEDWFNHVIPALMLFRSYILSSRRKLPRYTLDVQSSSGHNRSRKFGSPPRAAKSKRKFQLYTPTNKAFGEKNLRDWLDGVPYPY